MKNIEFYYDDLIRCRTFKDAHNLAIDKGLIPCECIEEIQELLIWLNEEHQILDKQEKEYLSAVIKPFEKRVELIAKVRYNDFKYFIQISLTNGERVNLPLFDCIKDIYIGMESDVDYTLEELGL